MKDSQGRFAYTVLMPAHNSAATVTASIASALSQTVPPEQVLLVDDGSDDDTAALASSVGATVLSQSRKGSAAARNCGLEEVRTPYVATLDADDTWLPRMAEVHAGVWAGLGADVAATGAFLRPVGPAAGAAWRQRRTARASEPRRVTAEELWSGNPFPCSATMFRTAALRQVGGWSEVPAVEDYDLLVRLWASGRDLVRIDEVLGTYYVGTGQKTAVVARGLSGERRAVTLLFETSRRAAELPHADLAARLRAAWWHAAARCANYRVPLSTLPSITEYGGRRPAVHLFAGGLVTLPAVSAVAASAWRTVGRMRRDPSADG